MGIVKLTGWYDCVSSPSLRPVLGGLSVVGIALSIVLSIGNQLPTSVSPPRAGDGGTLSNVVSEFEDRAQWIVLSTALGVALITSCGISLRCIRQSVARDKRSRSLWATCVSCIVGFGVTFAFAMIDRQSGATVGWRAVALIYTRADIANVCLFLNAFAAVPMICFMFASSAIVANTLRLMESHKLSKPTAQDCVQMRCNNRRLRLLLYSVSAAMIVGVLEIYALYDWVSSYVAADTATSIRQYGAALAIAMGSGFTMFIACVYLPAYYAQRRSTEELVARAVPHASEDERRGAYAQLGLPASADHVLLRAISILGPVAAGLLGGSISDAAGTILRQFGNP